jgi:hypothetical protein
MNAQEPTAVRRIQLQCANKNDADGAFCSRCENLESTLCRENRDQGLRQQKTKEKLICASQNDEDLETIWAWFFSVSPAAESRNNPAAKERNNLKIGKQDRAQNSALDLSGENPWRTKTGVRQQPVARESQIQQNKINKETDWTHKTKIDFFHSHQTRFIITLTPSLIIRTRSNSCHPNPNLEM